MNGPEFLFFFTLLYLIAAGSVYVAVRTRRSNFKRIVAELRDPLAIAAYFQGADRAIGVALSNASLFKIEPAKKTTVKRAVQYLPSGQSPLTRAIFLRIPEEGVEASAIFNDKVVQQEAAALRQNVRPNSPLAGSSSHPIAWDNLFHGPLLVAVGVMSALAALRILLSISHGHYNVLYLLGMSVVYPLLIWACYKTAAAVAQKDVQDLAVSSGLDNACLGYAMLSAAPISGLVLHRQGNTSTVGGSSCSTTVSSCSSGCSSGSSSCGSSCASGCGGGD